MIVHVSHQGLTVLKALAAQLEQLYDVWWQLFAGYHVSDDELQRMFQRGGRMELANRLIDVLQNREHFGWIAVSLGFFDTLMSLSAASTSSSPCVMMIKSVPREAASIITPMMLFPLTLWPTMSITFANLAAIASTSVSAAT